jgi:hypothetical protein
MKNSVEVHGTSPKKAQILSNIDMDRDTFAGDQKHIFDLLVHIRYLSAQFHYELARVPGNRAFLSILNSICLKLSTTTRMHMQLQVITRKLPSWQGRDNLNKFNPIPCKPPSSVKKSGNTCTAEGDCSFANCEVGESFSEGSRDRMASEE